MRQQGTQKGKVGREPRIEVVAEKKLVGMYLPMSLSQDRTGELWGAFMSRRKEVLSPISTNLICMQIYEGRPSFSQFNAETEFVKWAAVEVKDAAEVPHGMEAYTLLGGMYAVFVHKGLPNSFSQTAQFIFGNWLPKSRYELDNREHFEVMGERYRRNDPNSEEEVWVPIRIRK